MPLRSVSLLIVIVLKCVLLHAQIEHDLHDDDYPQVQSKVNYLDLRFGWMHSRMIDDGYSKNLLFRGTNSKLSVGYTRATSRYHFHFSMEGSTGKIKSKESDLPSNFYTLQPSVDYLRKVNDHSFLLTWGRLYVGVGMSSTNYFAINEAVFDNARLLSLHGLYLDIRERMQFNETQYLQLTYRLPAAVYVNQLLWNGGASHLSYRDGEQWLRTLTTNGSFNYFDVFRNAEFTADYGRNLGMRAQFVVGYKFRYFRNRDEAGTNIYTNELLFGLKIRL